MTTILILIMVLVIVLVISTATMKHHKSTGGAVKYVNNDDDETWSTSQGTMSMWSVAGKDNNWHQEQNNTSHCTTSYAEEYKEDNDTVFFNGTLQTWT